MADTFPTREEFDRAVRTTKGRRQFLNTIRRTAMLAAFTRYDPLSARESDLAHELGVRASGTPETDEEQRRRLIHAAAQSGGSAQDLTAADVEFEGIYLLPYVINSPAAIGSVPANGDATCAITLREDNGNLLIAGGNAAGEPVATQERVVELAFPAAAPGATPATAPYMTFVRRYANVMAGMLGTGSWLTNSIQWVSELGGFIITYQSAYQVNNDRSIVFVVPGSSNDTFTSYGPWRTNVGAKVTCAPLHKVSSRFADAYLGGRRYCSASLKFGGAGHSHGAAVVTLGFTEFDPFTAPPNAPGFTVPIGTDYAVPATIRMWHDLSHRMRMPADYKICGPVGGGTLETAYDCEYGINLFTEEVPPWWGTGNPSAGTPDTVQSAVQVETNNRRGWLFFSAFGSTPPGYVAPFDADGKSHRGYNALTNVDADGWRTCCHGQRSTGGPDGGQSPGPWVHSSDWFIQGYGESRMVAGLGGPTLYPFWNTSPDFNIGIRSKIPYAFPFVDNTNLSIKAPSGWGTGAVFIPASNRVVVPFRVFENTSSFGSTGNDPYRAALLCLRIT
jgi:hypothetical protein